MMSLITISIIGIIIGILTNNHYILGNTALHLTIISIIVGYQELSLLINITPIPTLLYVFFLSISIGILVFKILTRLPIIGIYLKKIGG